MEVTFDFEINTLIDDDRLHAEEVNSIKNWLPNETLPQLTDEQIAVFLIACDREVDKTKTTIKNYYNITQLMPEVFTNRCVQKDSLQRMLDISYYCLLPTRTLDNCAVIILKARDPDYRKFDFETHLKLICMLLDSVVYVNPPDGLISLLDMEGASLMHLTVLKLRLVILFTRYVQEGLRLKMKSIHLFNGGYALNALYNVFKPFLQRNIKELTSLKHLICMRMGLLKVFLQYVLQAQPLQMKKIHFINAFPLLHNFLALIKIFYRTIVAEKVVVHNIGNDTIQFHDNYISQNFFPIDYGGDMPCCQTLHRNQIEKFKQMADYFTSEQEQRRRKSS